MVRQLVSATIATLVAGGILVSLGVWQIRRLHWKEGLLQKIAAAEAAAPVELQDGVSPKLFSKVIAHGVLRGDRAALYGASVRGDRMGAALVEVLDRVGEPPLLLVLGWVPTDHGRPAPISGPRDVTGYVRLPEHPGLLSAADDKRGLHFYTLDPAAIGAALGAPNAAPFTLVALKNPLGAPPPPDAPVPAEGFPQLSNNHLQYALTWFGLAAALVGVFVAWVFRRPRGETLTG